MNRLLSHLAALFFMLMLLNSASAQDKIYTIYREIFNGKVTEVGPRQIKYVPSDNPAGPVYVLNIRIIDSIKYANGKVDLIEARDKRNLLENIPQLNTWSFDMFGFVFYTVSQSYERRLKSGKVGFRVPLYISYRDGGIAGEAYFNPSKNTHGVYELYNGTAAGSAKGASLSTGLNVKCYLFKRRIVRVFAGPESTIGYSELRSRYSYAGGGNYYNQYTHVNLGNFAALGKAGINFNPIDRLSINVDGGAGVGCEFEKQNPTIWTGVWQVGLQIGTNF